MAGSHYVAIEVRYEPGSCNRAFLASTAPELGDAGLALIEDHLGHPKPSRTWAGRVDGQTFRRFAIAWALDRATWDFDRGREDAVYEKTFDGMNWEVDGVSPIISVSVKVGPAPRPDAGRQRCAAREAGRGTRLNRARAGRGSPT